MRADLQRPSIQDISVAADAVIFTVRDGRLCVLLIQMKKRPYGGRWALPGGLIEGKETTMAAAKRILKGQTGVGKAFLEQLATFDEPGRDPFGRVVSVAYMALVPSGDVRLKTTEKYSDVRWWPVDRLPRLAYDHSLMAKVALNRLRGKLSYTNIAWSVLPREFTLGELQAAYEAILGRGLDKRNFRKKALSLTLLKRAGKLLGQAHRPAQMYSFRTTEPTQVEIV
jgi:8-oxo-dGTP diphosphatase